MAVWEGCELLGGTYLPCSWIYGLEAGTRSKGRYMGLLWKEDVPVEQWELNQEFSGPRRYEE
jgi:hypothetical protein